MRTDFDLTPFRRSSVGFDRLFDMLENGVTNQMVDTYPPFDLVREGEDGFRVTLAVAGFRPDELDIVSQQNLLIVSGTKTEQNEESYVHRGIGMRSFERRFVLGDYVRVQNADLKDGLLSIELKREIPEEMKPRKIEVRGADHLARLSDQRDPAANENKTERTAA